MPKESNPPSFPSWLIDLLVVVALMAAGWMASDRLDKWLDLHLDDETFYLGHGAGFPDLALQRASWGPLYSVWYWAVSRVFAVKALSLYLLNQRLLILVLPAMLFIAMRSFRVSRPVALVLAWLFAISNLNIVTLPKVGHFAAVVVLATLALSSRMRGSTPAHWSCLSLGFLTASYVRPEFFLAFLMALITLGFQEIRSRWKNDSSTWKSLWIPGMTLVLVIGALGAKGVPVDSRSFGAFSQHFSLNWAGRHPEAALNGWTDYDQIMAKNFGSSNTLTSAVLANPRAVFSHLAQNALSLVHDLTDQTLSHRPILTTSTRRWPWLESVVILALLVFLAGRPRPGLLVGRVRANAACLTGIIPPLVAALAATVVIHPDPHYLITVAVCVLLAVSALTADRQAQPAPGHLALLRPLGLSVALAVVTPYFEEKARPLPGYAAIRHLKSLRYQGEAVVLSSSASGHQLIGRNWKTLASWDKRRDEGFLDFITRKKVNFIVVDRQMTGDSRYRDDPDWLRFLSDPATAGFAESHLTDAAPDIRIFVRKDIAPSH